MRERDQLFKQYLRLKNAEKKENTHLQYKKLRNEIIALTRTKRKQFYKNYFKNLRKVWQ